MSDTAANPNQGPATTDDVVALLMREQETAEAVTEGSPQAADATTTEPDTSQEQDPAEQTEEPAEPRYTVKVRGEEREVSLQELRDGYSRTEDYRAKTAEVAEQRKAAERIQAEFAARTQRIDDLLSRAQLDPVLADGQQTDWQALARDNPAEYVARKEQYEGRMRYWHEVNAARNHAASQAAKAAVEESDRRLREAVPEWADPDKRKALQTGIASTLKEYGFASEEFENVADHRVLLVARDAMLWRQQQATRKAVDAKKAAAPPPRTVAPGAPQGESRGSAKVQALLKTAARSGRVDDQVNAIMAALE